MPRQARLIADQSDTGGPTEQADAPASPDVAEWPHLIEQSFDDRGVEHDGPWLKIGVNNRIGGWKLHLSTIQVDAAALVARVTPILREYAVAFKLVRDEETLGRLNGAELGPGQIGKFITVYPETDEQAVDLARSLARATADLRGPVVLTDLRLGDILYARYGSFNPVIVRDRLGQHLPLVDGADELQVDRYEVPYKPPDGVPNPFIDWEYQPDEGPAAPIESPGKLFGPGYLLTGVLTTHAKGFVFVALDLREREQAGVRIIKQGRRFCFSDQYGRDIRTRLQRQYLLHQELCDSVNVARPDPYFEVQGDGYLPLEFVPGGSIETLVQETLGQRCWGDTPDEPRQLVLSKLLDLVKQIGAMHKLGYVHRDLSASNVWVSRQGSVHLLDLELAHQIGDVEPPYELGTLGFMSPQQFNRECPRFEDDIYALGAIAILCLTGFDPRRICFEDQSQLQECLCGLTRGISSNLAAALAAAVAHEPQARPSLEDFDTAVRSEVSETARARTIRSPLATQDLLPDDATLTALITAGQRGLFEEAPQDGSTGLWLSGVLSEQHAQGAISMSTGNLEVRRSANRGVAGVVYLLGRLARFGFALTEPQAQRLRRAADWLVEGNNAADAGMPGLHFGEAGVAVALAECVDAGILSPSGVVGQFIPRALAGPLDWPDITHGAAGQGIAALCCADRLRRPDLFKYAHRCAAYLIEEQCEDGSWMMPDGVDGMSGEKLTGFAHGVSGMVYFLAAYASRFGDEASLRSCDAGAKWLVREAIEADDGRWVEWRISDANDDRWRWWCHGGPGIALTFLRLHEAFGDPQHAQIARQALRVHHEGVLAPNLTQCHGLSGLGDILLEAYRVLEEEEWITRAAHIANVLGSLARTTSNGAATWIVEDPATPTADLMVGGGGVIHFFLRLLLGGRSAGFPLLLEPV